jgi:SAM-dependent methyltransferase
MISVVVTGVPDWVPHRRLLGEHAWTQLEAGWSASLTRDEAADLAARLHNVGLGGQELSLMLRPRLKRTAIRAGRTRDARARRQTTPGFKRSGCHLDDEGRWSLTPEALATRLASRWAGASVVDATCGAGGNAIAFARAGCRVTAIDRDAARLNDALHNAARYGVAKQITFIRGDAVSEAASRTADLLFVDPPWGIEWDRARTTPHQLPPLSALLELPYPSCVAKVPPSFDPTTVPSGRPEAWFGAAPGDRHRVKFVTVACGLPATATASARAR